MPDASPALVLVGHGSERHPGAAAALLRHSALLSQAGGFAGVSAGFLAGSPTLAEALAAVPGTTVDLLPFFMSGGWLVRVGLPRTAEAVSAGRTLRYLPPIGSHPGIADVLARRSEAACRAAGMTPATATLLVVGHGNRRSPTAGALVCRQSAAIAASGRFREVRTAFLEQEPLLTRALARLPDPAVVVGCLSGAGRHGAEDIPNAIAGRVPYAGSVGEDPAMVAILRDHAKAGLTSGG